MENNNWHKGYKEVKNTIHNDIGVTKEEILEVFRQVAKDEIKEIVCENQAFIWNTLQEVIRHEMLKAIQDHKYPKVTGNMWNYGYNGQGVTSFQDYVSGVMKEEIAKRMEEQFDVSVNINKKN
ncbi:hypothetical protein [Robertmurraya siralis]|uniref:hypothetical protein n=1 Tax=Robertmurraya siralis TaxID=77777 RepID=UPI0010F90C84|nr:hypothetical protein [Robertmurraya siralis]